MQHRLIWRVPEGHVLDRDIGPGGLEGMFSHEEFGLVEKGDESSGGF